MLLVIEGGQIFDWKKNTKQSRGICNKTTKRSCDVAKMTITKDVRSNLAELLGVRRPATVSRVDRECIERVGGVDCKRGQIWQQQEHGSL
jgi:hypothetical protein